MDFLDTVESKFKLCPLLWDGDYTPLNWKKSFTFHSENVFPFIREVDSKFTLNIGNSADDFSARFFQDEEGTRYGCVGFATNSTP
jgi:hypothetical protein